MLQDEAVEEFYEVWSHKPWSSYLMHIYKKEKEKGQCVFLSVGLMNLTPRWVS